MALPRATAPIAAGPSLPTMMVSTTPCAIQPSSLSTTGTASTTSARSSALHSGFDWLISPMYPPPTPPHAAEKLGESGKKLSSQAVPLQVSGHDGVPSGSRAARAAKCAWALAPEGGSIVVRRLFVQPVQARRVGNPYPNALSSGAWLSAFSRPTEPKDPRLHSRNHSASFRPRTQTSPGKFGHPCRKPNTPEPTPNPAPAVSRSNSTRSNSRSAGDTFRTSRTLREFHPIRRLIVTIPALDECIGDFARIENRSQLHRRFLVSIGSFFRGRNQAGFTVTGRGLSKGMRI